MLHTTSRPPLGFTFLLEFIGLKSGNRNSAFADFAAAAALRMFVSGLLMMWGLRVCRASTRQMTEREWIPSFAGRGGAFTQGLFVLGLCGCCGRSCLWRCWRFRLAGLVIIVVLVVIVVVSVTVVGAVAVAAAEILRLLGRRRRQRLLIFGLLPTMVDQAGEQRRVTSCCCCR